MKIRNVLLVVVVCAVVASLGAAASRVYTRRAAAEALGDPEISGRGAALDRGLLELALNGNVGDDAVFHGSFYLSEELMNVRTRALGRVVNIASYITIGDTLEPALGHLSRFVPVDGSDALSFELGCGGDSPAEAPMNFRIDVAPRSGLTWKDVHVVADFEVMATAIGG